MHDQTVFLPVGGSQHGIAAFDLASGKQVWTALDEPASSASPLLWNRSADGHAPQSDLVIQTTLRIAGLEPDSGKLRWDGFGPHEAEHVERRSTDPTHRSRRTSDS